MLTAFRVGLKEIEKLVDSTKENLVVVNNNGEIVLQKEGGEDHIRIECTEIGAVLNAHVFHNHPPFVKQGRIFHGAWLSDGDVRSLFFYQLKSMTSISKYCGKIIATTMYRKETTQPMTQLLDIAPNIPFGQVYCYTNDGLIKKMDSHWKALAKMYSVQYRQYVLKTLVQGG